MKMKVSFAVAMVAVITPTILFAAEDWLIGTARGLPTFSASVESGSLVMVCDPDRVYNPDVSYANFVVTLPQDPAARQIVFMSATGQQAAFDVRDGTATQQEARPADWTALVEMIQQGGTIAVVTARDTFSLDMKAMPDFDCD